MLILFLIKLQAFRLKKKLKKLKKPKKETPTRNLQNFQELLFLQKPPVAASAPSSKLNGFGVVKQWISLLHNFV